jgi:tetratricopeptide (TPR) repeat protein
MRAISISRSRRIAAGFDAVAGRGGRGFTLTSRRPGAVMVLAGLLMAGSARADTNYAALVENEYRAARNRFQAETNSAEAAWQFGRACFDLAELATNNAGKAAAAEQGVAACRRAITNDPASAPAHYYLGMTLGQQADTRRNLGALWTVKEVEREFKRALALDEQFDYAGPDRNLGLLYWQAPAVWSVGSRKKARQHLRRAIELAPGYPENRLNFIEACLEWGDTKEAVREFKALEDSWPGAQQEFSGAKWAPSRLDWEKRLNQARKKLGPAATDSD